MFPFRARFLMCAVLTGALFGSLGPITAQEKKDEKKAGKVEKKTYEFKDAKKDMEYALYVPGGYDKERKVPLVIALHGLGGNPQQFMRTRGLTQEAEKRGYIVAAPMGYNERGWYGQSVRFGAKKDEPENLRELSEKDVMNVLGIVKKEYNVDPDRVYLMGHSMGGGGTLHLAIKYPDEWAALGPIAPAIFSHRPTEAEKIKHIPVIMVQGAKDTLVKPELVRPWADEMKKLEMKYDYIEVTDGDHGNVVAPNVPKIFDFFDKHKRKEKKPEPKKDEPKPEVKK
jgi:poly(3-hydroxybutyrate) depolymerase